MDIVGWRPSNDGFISTQNGDLEMEIDGSVLCHIMNHYSVSLDLDPDVRYHPEPIPSRADQKLCEFPFGRSAWETSNDQIHAHFKPGAERDLKARKRPFWPVRLELEPNTWIIATYVTALVHGVSDPDLRLADARAPLKERIERFLSCMRKLESGIEKSRVISYLWIGEAARVKRRVLAQGGNDYSFFTDICETIDRSPRFSFDFNRSGHRQMKDMIRKFFLLDKETFTFSVPGSFSTSMDPDEKIMDTPAIETLDGYKDQPPRTWKRELYNMRVDVMTVLKTCNNVMIKRNIWLMEFTTGCALWNERVLLG
jgi:hypothetical protein